MGDFVPTQPNHPTMPMPGVAELMKLSPANLEDFLVTREAALTAERSDPIAHGWEPPMWRLTDAICGFPWIDESWAADVRRAVQTLRGDGPD